MDWDDVETCPPGEHSFSRSADTNEPVGVCSYCAMTVEWAERQEEAEPPLAFADVPPQDHEAYLAALDAESVRENR